MTLNWSFESRENTTFVVVVYSSETPSIRIWIDAIESIVRDERYRPGMGFILDRRQVSVVASSSDVADALGYIQKNQHLFKRSRWSVLQGNIASFGMARMGQLMSAYLPIEVEIFDDLDEAKDWICSKNQ